MAPAHGFPQLIAYSREDATLDTEISGVDAIGDDQRAGWVFERIP